MMTNSGRVIFVGDAKVSILNSGDSVSTIAECVEVPKESRGDYGKTLEEKYLSPTWAIHISLPGGSILVDPNDYDVSCPPGSPSVPAGYQRPPIITEQLRSAGTDPGTITHVIVTHRHYDHYLGVTVRDGVGKYVPAYPDARYLVSRADWDSTEILEEKARKLGVMLLDQEEGTRSLGVIHRANKLDLVEEDVEVIPGVTIISAPGETPGHQAIRVRSGGQSLYCIGDLYHHQIEVEHPDWMATWADPKENVPSRQRLAGAAANEKALLVAGHMPIGRIERTASGFRWVEVP
jgi:glyoxylase-like metal-dependent hydrolase (beta-lactamase superfamily II)